MSFLNNSLPRSDSQPNGRSRVLLLTVCGIGYVLLVLVLTGVWRSAEIVGKTFTVNGSRIWVNVELRAGQVYAQAKELRGWQENGWYSITLLGPAELLKAGRPAINFDESTRQISIQIGDQQWSVNERSGTISD